MGDIPNRRLLLTASVVAYVAVTAAMVAFEQPGMGIGHFFYIAIALAALALGPVGGASAGVLATILFSAAIMFNHALPTRDLIAVSSPIRLVTFVLVGGLLGWFAAGHRAALGELRVLAERDWVTGLPNTRAFEKAVDRRLSSGEPFALLLGDVDGFRILNEDGHAAGDEVLRRIGAELVRLVGIDDEVARIGGDEFAIVSSCRTLEEAGRLAAHLQRALGDDGVKLTFGWSASPQEGTNALSLYRAADERLYARRLLRDRPPRELHALPA